MLTSPGAANTFRAAHDLSIAVHPEAWYLYNGSPRPDAPDARTLLVEATAQQITCAAAFAQSRQMPRAVLFPAEIARVVVGWAPESRNWHLGLLLAAQPDTQNKMRWCGLARWPAGAAYEHRAAAHSAGQALARLIARPFHLIPAPEEPPLFLGDTQPVQTTARLDSITPVLPMPVIVGPGTPPPPSVIVSPVQDEAPVIPLKTPPFEFDHWTLRAVPQGYLWSRRGSWLWGSLWRVIGFGALVLLYLVLGVGVQTAGLADVRPAWLPWLGLAVALVMAALAGSHLAHMLTAADTVIDTAARAVYHRQRFSGRDRWRLPFDQIAYVLLSQTAARQQGSPRGSTVPIAQDVWLHLYDGAQFYPIAALEGVTGSSARWDTVRVRQKTLGRRRLRLADYDTPAHHAAQVLADAIGAEVWLDLRR